MPVNLTMGLEVYRAVESVGRLLFPPLCALCGAPGAGDRDLCHGCIAALPANPVACPRCALPLATPAPACGRCLRAPPPFAAAHAPFRYGDPLDRLLTRFKFAADLAAGRVLGTLLVEAVAAALPRDAVVLPMPLHRRRLAERGFNQAWELTRMLARETGLPCRADLLLRMRPTDPQTGLDAAGRRRNVRGAFVVPPARAPRLAGRRVVLVDDVVTTGATGAEASRCLVRAGAAAVTVVAVARAAAPGRA
jgi:ComF family protein